MVYTATNKSTGQRWYYTSRRVFGKVQYAYAGCPDFVWCRSLAEAKRNAVERGVFSYI